MTTRRGFSTVLPTATARPLTGADTAGPASATDAPRTFVLVHGAWHGGWCWRRVVDLLRARGHRVFAPSLTGLGGRAHLFSKNISLQTHVQVILSVVETEELKSFILVGHSFGGMVISGVADTLRERAIHYVYVDARVPPDMSPGASFSCSSCDSPEVREGRLKSVREQGRGWRSRRLQPVHSQ